VGRKERRGEVQMGRVGRKDKKKKRGRVENAKK
jgi:hypothetical protein